MKALPISVTESRSATIPKILQWVDRLKTDGLINPELEVKVNKSLMGIEIAILGVDENRGKLRREMERRLRDIGYIVM